MTIPARVLPVLQVFDLPAGRLAYHPVSEPIECADPANDEEQTA